MVLGLLALSLRADLEVTVPPGVPTDWTTSYPQPALHGLGTAPRKSQRSSSEPGSVEMIEQPREQFIPPASIFDFSGITTRDLPAELPWTRPELTDHRSDVVVTGQDDTRPRMQYPPPVSDFMHWLAMATMLRTVMHPAQVSEAAAREHLVLLGYPALLAARRAKQEAALQTLADELIARIGSQPNKAPELTKGKTPYQTMLSRIAWTELGSGTPFEPGRPFATRLGWLELEALPIVLAYSRSEHIVVRRNAALLLASYSNNAAALTRLRELIDDKDDVVRNRAIHGLGINRDRLAVSELAKRVTGNNPGLDHLCAEALGRIADDDAVEPLLKLIERRSDQHEAWWAATPALARIGSNQAAYRERLRKLVERISNSNDRFEPSSNERARYARIRADSNDPISRTTATIQLGMIALAAMGDADARSYLFDLLDGKVVQQSPKQREIEELQLEFETIQAKLIELQAQWQRTPDRAAALQQELRKLQQRYQLVLQRLQQLGANPRPPLQGGRVFQKLATPARFIACDVLARFGNRGHLLLARIIEDRGEHSALRAYALQRIDLSAAYSFIEQAELLKRWALSDWPPIVRVEALGQLERLDPSLATEAAKTMVQNYLAQQVELLDDPVRQGKRFPVDGRIQVLPSLRDWIVVEAIRVLGRAGQADNELLRAVIQHADKERTTAAELEQREKDALKQGGDPYALDIKVFVLPPLLEVALLEAGRGGAIELLLRQLERDAAHGRPHAALALGAIQRPEVAPRLVELLEDREPFVRLMAYRALRNLSGEDHSCDWIWGEPADRNKTVASWKAWLAKR
jgi:HEAT repeat protein